MLYIQNTTAENYNINRTILNECDCFLSKHDQLSNILLRKYAVLEAN